MISSTRNPSRTRHKSLESLVRLTAHAGFGGRLSGKGPDYRDLAGQPTLQFRKLGIATLADRVVQASLKLVLEPIFEADFQPCSFGFRPGRRAQDAIAEIQLFATKGYTWVLEADIRACFDEIGHVALMDRLRGRIKDKRVLALVKAFLKAGVRTCAGDRQDTLTGTPQGGILSPLLANTALSALDEHFARQWEPHGSQRKKRIRKGLGNWRLVRYADDCAPRAQMGVAM